jgi:hypothetical protein
MSISEEVYLVSGDLTVGNDEHGKDGESFAPKRAACCSRSTISIRHKT